MNEGASISHRLLGDDNGSLRLALPQPGYCRVLDKVCLLDKHAARAADEEGARYARKAVLNVVLGDKRLTIPSVPARRDTRDKANKAAAHAVIAPGSLGNVARSAARAAADVAAVRRAARLCAALRNLAPAEQGAH